jgi:hypothetical protein
VKYQTCGKRSQGWLFRGLRDCKWDRDKSGGLKPCNLYDGNDDDDDDNNDDYDDDDLCRIRNYEQNPKAKCSVCNI